MASAIRDYSLIINTLAELRLTERSNLLMIADVPTIFTATFSDGGDRVVRIRSSHMLSQPYEVYEPLHGRFDACLMEIRSANSRGPTRCSTGSRR